MRKGKSMKLLIAIPSKGRSKSIYRRTLRWITRTGYDVRIFVEPQDIEAYRAGIEHANYSEWLDIHPDQFIDIGQNDQGLGYAKDFIKQYALDNGYDLVFKMDDDVLRFAPRGPFKDDGGMIIDFAGAVGACRKAFGRYPDIGAIGFPYRNELYETAKEWTHINARLQTCYIIRAELLQGGFNTLEDFAQYAYLRSQNKVTTRYGLIGIDCAEVGTGKGGLQAFDREAQLDVEIPKLQEIYPAVRFKPVKGKKWSIEPDMTGEFFGVVKL